MEHVADPTGLVLGSRLSSTAIELYQNDSNTGTYTAGSAAPVNAALSLFSMGGMS